MSIQHVFLKMLDRENYFAGKIQTEENMQKALVDTSIKIISDISSLYLEQLQNVKENDKLLNQGIWYGTDYYKACENLKQNERIIFLEGKNGFKGYLNKKIFQQKDGVDAVIYASAKEKFSAFNALKAAFGIGKKKRFSILDCNTVCRLARITTLLHILGKQKFNKVFSKDGLGTINLGSSNENNPMNYLIYKKYGKIEKGDRVYFHGHRNYRKEHGPLGPSQGFCLICTNKKKQLFSGFGLEPNVTTNYIKEMLEKDFLEEGQNLDKKLLKTKITVPDKKEHFEFDKLVSYFDHRSIFKLYKAPSAKISEICKGLIFKKT